MHYDIEKKNIILNDLKAAFLWEVERGNKRVILFFENVKNSTSKKNSVEILKYKNIDHSNIRSILLEEINNEILNCNLCQLCKTRTKPVPGEGICNSDIMFIGEGPGYYEDMAGRPFVGPAGELLTRIIKKMNYERDSVFITNVVKCRPPNNRTPLPEEIEPCIKYLKKQIELINPKVIILLGATAVRGLLGIETGIKAIRGKWFKYENIPVMPTFHPSYLLRNKEARWDTWKDMCEVLTYLGKTVK